MCRRNNVIICIALLCLDTVISSLDIKSHLKAFEDYRFPLGSHRQNWTMATNYIRETFENVGLVVDSQQFNTKIGSLNNGIVEVQGTNVIGQSLSSSRDDPIVLIGANYDSTLQWNPLMENGASMAAILALVSAFQTMKENGDFMQNTTVIFVAFDINAEAHVPVGPGDSGATYFVRDFLPQILTGKEFKGAVILDSISNYNVEKNSQVFLKGFSEIFPEVFERLKSDGKKGDFLAQMTKFGVENMEFARHFKQIYQNVVPHSDFHLEELKVEDGDPVSPYLSNSINQKAHVAFWTNSLPAFLLTDMGITRQSSDGDLCRQICDASHFWNDQRKDFVQMTTKALLEMLLQYQTLTDSNQHQYYTEEPHPTTSGKIPKPDISTSNDIHGITFHRCIVLIVMQILSYLTFKL